MYFDNFHRRVIIGNQFSESGDGNRNCSTGMSAEEIPSENSTPEHMIPKPTTVVKVVFSTTKVCAIFTVCNDCLIRKFLQDVQEIIIKEKKVMNNNFRNISVNASFDKFTFHFCLHYLAISCKIMFMFTW